MKNYWFINFIIVLCSPVLVSLDSKRNSFDSGLLFPTLSIATQGSLAVKIKLIYFILFIFYLIVVIIIG